MMRERTDWKRGPARSRGKRLGAEAWERFLGLLATMSATEASKRPGMPSRAAFIMRRRRHPDFDNRATEIMASRRLETGGRKRITGDQWAAFLARIDSCCIEHVCRQPGMPSQGAVYKRRRNDPAFATELTGTLRVRLQLRLEAALLTREGNGWARRQHDAHVRAFRYAQRRAARERNAVAPGALFQRKLAENLLYRAAMEAVPAHLDQITRDDIAADMMLAVLEGRINVADLKMQAREFSRQHWKLFGTYGVISLDAPLRSDSKSTLHDVIAA